MADTTPVETAPPAAPSNDTGTTTTPIVDTGSADVEAAKREAEKLAIRNKQLENDLAKVREAQDAAQKKQLEEKEEFKTLYEQTQSKLEELSANQKAEQDRQTLARATEELFKTYDATVVELAKTAGLTLGEDTDEARNALKEKLETFKSKVSPAATSSGRVMPNNPSNPAPTNPDRAALTARAEDGSSPMAMAGAKGDDSVALQYIRTLPAIQRMKEMAREGN